MTARLIYLTSDVDVARAAEKAGVDWIFVDLEYRGKADRQAGRNTVVSAHSLDDVANVRSALRGNAKLLVRVNPIGPWSAGEIDGAIEHGADIVMLPFFSTPEEVSTFVHQVAGRARTCLLVETLGALDGLDAILDVPGIDFVHIGLNDIHIARKTRFMFELLADGSVDEIAATIRAHRIPFGIGGMARIGEKVPPAENILAEHYRLGSTGVILSRTFCDAAAVGDPAEIARQLVEGVAAIRACEARIAGESSEFFEANRILTRDQIYQVAEEIGGQ